MLGNNEALSCSLAASLGNPLGTKEGDVDGMRLGVRLSCSLGHLPTPKKETLMEQDLKEGLILHLDIY